MLRQLLRVWQGTVLRQGGRQNGGCLFQFMSSSNISQILPHGSLQGMNCNVSTASNYYTGPVSINVHDDDDAAHVIVVPLHVQGPHFADWELWHEQGALSMAAVPLTSGSDDSSLVVGSLSFASTCTAAFSKYASPPIPTMAAHTYTQTQACTNAHTNTHGNTQYTHTHTGTLAHTAHTHAANPGSQLCCCKLAPHADVPSCIKA